MPPTLLMSRREFLPKPWRYLHSVLSFFSRSIFDNLIMHEEREEIKIQPIHVANALVSLKSRHRLSNQCIEDILSLLRLFSKDIPSSYKNLCTLLRKRSIAHVRPESSTICPHCERISSKLDVCTMCGAKYSPIPTPIIPLFYTYDIAHQIQAILSSSPDLLLVDKLAQIGDLTDIKGGDIYQKLIATESDRFITLTINVDGIQPNKGTDQSIWPVLLIINEISRKKRFARENLILGGMWPGPAKPSRGQMTLFLEKIVLQLKILEAGRMFQMYSTSDDIQTQFLKVFLLTGCCDKPAQALLQCLSEPTAFFGCGACEIKGECCYYSETAMKYLLVYLKKGSSVATRNDGTIVSFVVNEDDPPAVERCNERHDFYQEQLKKNAVELANFTGSHGRSALLKEHKKSLKGSKGPSPFRSLSKFDVGRSFAFDSLHNLYLGLFVSSCFAESFINSIFCRSDFSHCGSVLSTRTTFGRFLRKFRNSPLDSIGFVFHLQQHAIRERCRDLLNTKVVNCAYFYYSAIRSLKTCRRLNITHTCY